MENSLSEICGNCGSVNSFKKRVEGGPSTGIFLLLLLLAIVPGLLYYGFAKKRREFYVCSGCGGEDNYLNLSTPKGKQLFQQYFPNEPLPTLKKQSWHGL